MIRKSDKKVYLLGGYQTDFARNWAKEGKGLQAMINETIEGGLRETDLEAIDIDVAHVGNFAGELYNKQGHMGAMIVNYDKVFRGLPTSRHEAACASGAISTLVGRTEIESGIYDCAMILGIEYMKSVDSKTGGDFLGTAAWYEKEAEGIEFPFPKLFGRLGDLYQERYGLKHEHLAHISAVNYANAKKNPKAQTRDWYMSEEHANCNSSFNSTIGGIIRISDCSQVTDGGSIIFLASETFTEKYAKKRGIKKESLPYIQGWGHRTAPILFDEKVDEARESEYTLPHTRVAITDAYKRAGISGPADLNSIETHDCFTTSEYAAIEHFGITKTGEAWKAIEEGVIDFNGSLPINPSGGLIGVGHPVGGTGVRQLLDSYKQVTQTANEYQIEGSRRVATLNIGGSATTNVVHIVGVDA